MTSFDESNWDEAVLASPRPVLAGFWAEWCIPSRAMGALLEAAARELPGKVSVGLVDHDANPRLAERYRIQGLPTLVLLANGSELARRVGLMDVEAVTRLLDGRV